MTSGEERIKLETPGVKYHPVHREVLSSDAKMWMPLVKRFYERRLLGAELISGPVAQR